MILWQQFQTALASLPLLQMGEEADGLLREIERQAAHAGCSPDEMLLALLDQGLRTYREAHRVQQGWKSLSLREKQVTALICQGLTSRQAAARLVLSPETIKTHVRHILRKFGLRTRRELCQALEGRSFDPILASIGDAVASSR